VSTGTSIEWTDATWNPTTGCRKVSPGCDHCYAATLAKRLKAMRNPRYQNDGPDGPGFGLTLHPDKVDEPKRWRMPRRVFVNSMSDLFHVDVPARFIARIFSTMAACPQHEFQVLTKRPKRMREVVSALPPQLQALPNVWLGVSIENDDYTWRADHLRETPAAVRFLSLEPLLGPVPSLKLDGIDWAIVGGESGPGHRPVDAAWVRDIQRACARAGVAFFFKQWGGPTPKAGGRELDGRTWDQWPSAGARASTAPAQSPRTAGLPSGKSRSSHPLPTT
jgi:protein gp37